MSALAELTAGSFDAAVLANGRPVLVDFWAPRCGPCRMLAPILDKLSRELASEVAFAKVDVDREPDLAERFGVGAIPALVLFAGGRVVRRVVGFHPERELRRFVSAPIPGAGEEGRA